MVIHPSVGPTQRIARASIHLSLCSCYIRFIMAATAGDSNSNLADSLPSFFCCFLFNEVQATPSAGICYVNDVHMVECGRVFYCRNTLHMRSSLCSKCSSGLFGLIVPLDQLETFTKRTNFASKRFEDSRAIEGLQSRVFEFHFE